MSQYNYYQLSDKTLEKIKQSDFEKQERGTGSQSFKQNKTKQIVKPNQSKRRTPKEIKIYRGKLLKERGFTLLKEEDIKARKLDKISMMCKDGHIVNKSFHDIRRSTNSCRECRLEATKANWVERAAEKGCTLDPNSVKGKKATFVCNKINHSEKQTINFLYYIDKRIVLCKFCTIDVKTSRVVGWVESHKGRMADPNYECKKFLQEASYYCSKNHPNTKTIKELTRHDYLPCGECNNTRSNGEMAVEKYLQKHELSFAAEHTPVSLNRLCYDFKLNDHQVHIEFDGQQHFDPKSFSYFNKTSDGFDRQRQRDLVKNQYCKDNGILLIRIHYSWMNNLWNLDNELWKCINDKSGQQIITLPNNHPHYYWVHQPPKREFMKWYVKNYNDLEDGDEEYEEIDYDQDVYEEEEQEEDKDEDEEEIDEDEEEIDEDEEEIDEDEEDKDLEEIDEDEDEQ
ncbi:hypothetical protein DFA_09995 [Cavenderia fasciculata]|uniref:DUF559 domain-containing protein n=1 Tax=Cavenderia fasciculata TaxID=261658 RepID=F4Q900_CACFS|nr:uncharacterized protein DFA_09995 [Cavenderia fasciculata]EGG15169.1 hypothetical protein DFA_09995 [Cavenderia fasciculata]|eukprot:XP_004351889.1 hypothetical protein DFA_09995 [Cavenderia fasciculata]